MDLQTEWNLDLLQMFITFDILYCIVEAIMHQNNWAAKWQNKVTVQPAKTQIHQVWSEPLLCA